MLGDEESAFAGLGVDDRRQHVVERVDHRVCLRDGLGIPVQIAGAAVTDDDVDQQQDHEQRAAGDESGAKGAENRGHQSGQSILGGSGSSFRRLQALGQSTRAA